MFHADATPLAPPPPLDCRGRPLRFDGPTHLMGIVNVTPDSFSDGGRFLDPRSAVAHGLELERAGAAILDVGGESARPGASAVSAAEEIDRVVPVIRGLVEAGSGALLSVDTMKPEVARAALEAGAHLVNDVTGLGHDPGLAAVAASFGAPLVLMHMRGTPATMSSLTDYPAGDLLGALERFFRERIALASDQGLAPAQIVLDPGVGFAKTAPQSFELVRHLARLAALGRPLLLGPSRKSFLAWALGEPRRPPQEREWATAASVACGIFAGAHIVRVHDVVAMRDVARVADGVVGRESL